MNKNQVKMELWHQGNIIETVVPASSVNSVGVAVDFGIDGIDEKITVYVRVYRRGIINVFGGTTDPGKTVDYSEHIKRLNKLKEEQEKKKQAAPPCPRCDVAPFIRECDDDHWCECDNCSLSTSSCDSAEKAVDEWNVIVKALRLCKNDK